jgi:hypothetical protein
MTFSFNGSTFTSPSDNTNPQVVAETALQVFEFLYFVTYFDATVSAIVAGADEPFQAATAATRGLMNDFKDLMSKEVDQTALSHE